MKRGTIDLDSLAEHIQISERGDHEYFLDKETGQVIALPQQVLRTGQHGKAQGNPAGGTNPSIPEWARPLLPVARSILGGEMRYVQIPCLSPRFPYRTMVEFACSLPEPDRDELLGLLQGKGAFRRFKHFLRLRPEHASSWRRFRDGKVKEIAALWLDCIGVDYEPDGNGDGGKSEAGSKRIGRD